MIYMRNMHVPHRRDDKWVDDFPTLNYMYHTTYIHIDNKTCSPSAVKAISSGSCLWSPGSLGYTSSAACRG